MLSRKTAQTISKSRSIILFAGLLFAAYNRKEDIGNRDAQSALMTVIGGWIDQAGTYSPDTPQTDDHIDTLWPGRPINL